MLPSAILVHFEQKPTEMMCDLHSVWQVQLCEFVSAPRLTQSWAGSKCLVLSLVK